MRLKMIATMALTASVLALVPPRSGADSAKSPEFPILEGHRLTLLNSGEEWLAAKAKLIREAKKTVYIAAFSWSWDAIGQEFVQLMCDAAARRVEARILVDNHGGKAMLKHRDILDSCGVNVIAYNPLSWGILDAPYVLHEKLVIADGQSVVLGGTAYGMHYFESVPRTDQWHDQDTQIDGPAACWYHRKFQERWRISAKRAYGRSYRAPNMRPCEEIRAEGGTARVMPVLTDPLLSKKRPIRELYIKAFNSAKKVIRIYASYFIPDLAVGEALFRARLRGVKVVVVTNSRRSNDENTNSSYAIMHSSRKYVKRGIDVRVWNGKSTMHRKGIIVDDQISIFGSENFDRRGQNYSSESIAFTDDPGYIAERTLEFDLDAEFSESLTVAEIDRAMSEASDIQLLLLGLMRRQY